MVLQLSAALNLNGILKAKEETSFMIVLLHWIHTLLHKNNSFTVKWLSSPGFCRVRILLLLITIERRLPTFSWKLRTFYRKFSNALCLFDRNKLVYIKTYLSLLETLEETPIRRAVQKNHQANILF